VRSHARLAMPGPTLWNTVDASLATTCTYTAGTFVTLTPYAAVNTYTPARTTRARARTHIHKCTHTQIPLCEKTAYTRSACAKTKARMPCSCVCVCVCVCVRVCVCACLWHCVRAHTFMHVLDFCIHAKIHMRSRECAHRQLTDTNWQRTAT